MKKQAKTQKYTSHKLTGPSIVDVFRKDKRFCRCKFCSKNSVNLHMLETLDIKICTQCLERALGNLL